MREIPYITNVGAAEMCGCSETLVRRAITEGKLKVGAVTADGKYKLLRPADVKKWNATRPRRHKQATT